MLSYNSTYTNAVEIVLQHDFNMVSGSSKKPVEIVLFSCGFDCWERPLHARVSRSLLIG